MQTVRERFLWTGQSCFTQITLVSACLLWILGLGGSSNASDLQRSTDQAAVNAKRAMCIALNNGGDIAEPRENFFGFYEGKLVSAYRLDPETFSRGQIGSLPPFEVEQVLGPREMLVSIGSDFFKLRDVATDDVADDQNLHLKGLFFVCETETYNTVIGGTNTVYVLEPAGARTPKVEATRVYPWYSRKNEIVVTGEFKFIDEPNATFLVDGQEVSVPLIKFSRGDRDLMRIIAQRYPHDKAPAKSPETVPDNVPGKSPENPAPQPVGID